MQIYEISPNSWHWKIYLFAIAMWAKFLGNEMWEYECPNLCGYIRATLVYLPIMLFLNLAIYTSPLWILGTVSYVYGTDAMTVSFMFFAWVLLAIAAFIAVIFILLSLDHLKDMLIEKRRELQSEIAEEQMPKTSAKKSSFTHILLQFLRDRHDKICRPVIVKQAIPAEGGK